MPINEVDATVYLIDIVTTDVGLPVDFEPLRDRNDSKRRLRVRERTQTALLSALKGGKSVAGAITLDETELPYDVIGVKTGVWVDGNTIVFDGTGGLRIRSSKAEESDGATKFPVAYALLDLMRLLAKRFPTLSIDELSGQLNSETTEWRPWAAFVDVVKQLSEQETDVVILDKDIPALHFETTTLIAKKSHSACTLRPDALFPDKSDLDADARLLPVFWYPFKGEAFVAGLVAEPGGYFSFGRLGSLSDGYQPSRKYSPWDDDKGTIDFSFGRYGVLDEFGNLDYSKALELQRVTRGVPATNVLPTKPNTKIETYLSEIPFFLGAMPSDDPTKLKIAKLRDTDGAGFCFFEGKISCPENHETTFDPMVNCQGCN